jgi:hypothetical protein
MEEVFIPFVFPRIEAKLICDEWKKQSRYGESFSYGSFLDGLAMARLPMFPISHLLICPSAEALVTAPTKRRTL